MTDHPMLFSPPMVRALLEGRKTQTRRILKPRREVLDGKFYPLYVNGVRSGSSTHPEFSNVALDGDRPLWMGTSPYVPDDRIWCRETWSGDYGVRDVRPSERPEFLQGPIWYWADGNPVDGDWEKPRPGIHMPRWASRLTLTITEVRVQRLMEISERDAIAEGCAGVLGPNHDFPDEWDPSPEEEYRELWESLNAKRAPWADNPWVCAISFETHRRNIDELAR